jgi:hypothetical protein
MNVSFEPIAKLGFGGLFGSGLGALLYAIWPHWFPGGTSMNDLAIAGALLGGGVHRFIDGWISVILGPAGRYITYYSKCLELSWWYSRRWIDGDQLRELRRTLAESYFLDDIPNPQPRRLQSPRGRRALPPSSVT